LNDVVLWSTLLAEPLDEAMAGAEDRALATVEFLDPIIARIAMPRRIADAIRRITGMLPRLMQGKAGRLVKTELVGLAVDVLEIELETRGRSAASEGLVARLREEVAAAAPFVVPSRPARRGARWSSRARRS
jgi:hypothetical protein